VAEKGAKGPIFEGNMLPQKIYPQIGANIGAITGILLMNIKYHPQSQFHHHLQEQPRTEAGID
jgi:hypothetical protein